MLLTTDTQEIESDSYWTFHQVVPATASASTVVDAGSIERTVCEGCELLFTTQGLDHLVRVNRRYGTHAFYWPLVFFNVIIGPYLVNGACCRAICCRYIIYFINTWCSCHRCQTLARDKCRCNRLEYVVVDSQLDQVSTLFVFFYFILTLAKDSSRPPIHN